MIWFCDCAYCLFLFPLIAWQFLKRRIYCAWVVGDIQAMSVAGWIKYWRLRESKQGNLGLMRGVHFPSFWPSPMTQLSGDSKYTIREGIQPVQWYCDLNLVNALLDVFLKFFHYSSLTCQLRHFSLLVFFQIISICTYIKFQHHGNTIKYFRWFEEVSPWRAANRTSIFYFYQPRASPCS